AALQRYRHVAHVHAPLRVRRASPEACAAAIATGSVSSHGEVAPAERIAAFRDEIADRTASSGAGGSHLQRALDLVVVRPEALARELVQPVRLVPFLGNPLRHPKARA